MKNKISKFPGPLSEIASHLSESAFNMEEIVADGTGFTNLISEDLKRFPNLQYLFIPNNKLQTLNNLENNIRLKFIDARNNEISEIEIPKLEFVNELYLSNNKLQDLHKTMSKLLHMKFLQTLDLRGNPLTLETGYRQYVISLFPNLKVLDGITVVRSERNRNNANRKIQSRNYSVFQTITSRPHSSPDQIIQEKAERIRRKQEIKKWKEEEKMTEIARKRKAEFEEAAKKEPPIPDGLDFLGKSQMYKYNKDEKRPKSQTRTPTRMYLKVPFYTKTETIDDENDLRMIKLNPRLPNIFANKVSYTKKFPK